jgi:hypothetical protein
MGARTGKDWLGREKLSARMTGVSPEQVEAELAAAQRAWEAGRLAHVYMPRALAALDAAGIDEAVNRILEIGWILHSTALGTSTVGPNMQEAMFVFTRPPARS